MGIREIILYAQVLRRRWKPIIGLFLGTMVTLGIISIVAPRVYVASARLRAIAPSPGMTTLYGGFSTSGFRDELAYTQNTFIEILKSRVVARRTVESIDTALGAEDLQERAEIVLESDFIQLTVTAGGPEEAANLVNGLATQALAYYGELLVGSSGASREFITTQLELGRQELDQAQTELMQFKIENKIGSLDNDISQQTSLIRSLRLSRDNALAAGQVARADAYDVLIAEREQELQALLILSAQYQALQMAVAQALNTYDYLLSKEAEAQITENQIRNVSFIQMVEPAEAPSKSTSSLSKSLVALGGLLSLILGVAVAFTWEYIETSNVRQEVTSDDLVPRQQPISAN